MIEQQFGNWILNEELTRDTVGVLYKATASGDPKQHAIVKTLTHDSFRTADFLTRFPAEMLALRRLKHDNIITFHDAGVSQSTAWYACDFVEGTTLETVLQNRSLTDADGTPTWQTHGLSVAVQLARAMKHGHHRSILHRDLKPGNVWMMADGTLKVANFGVAKVAPVSALVIACRTVRQSRVLGSRTIQWQTADPQKRSLRAGWRDLCHRHGAAPILGGHTC